MKRILTLILVLALAVAAFASCDLINQYIPGLGECKEHVDENGDYICDKCEAELEKPHEHVFVDGKCECGAEDPNYVPPVVVDELLQAASDYIRQMYKDDPVVTAASYTLINVVPVGDVSITVTWTVDNEAITVTDNGDGTVTVNVPNESLVEIPYVLTATLSNDKGETLTRTFNHTVPEFEITSFEDYMAAKEGDSVIVQGIVVCINSKSLGNKYNHVYLMDENTLGAYYCYSITQDPVADLGIELGMTVRVSGPCTPYNGMQEIKGGTASIIDSNKKDVTPVDITDRFTKDTDFNALVGLPVIVRGVTLGGQVLDVETSQYLYFTLNGVESYVRTYITDFPTTLEQSKKGEIDALHASKFGYTADVTGILVTYSGTPYLIPTSVDCFYNFQLPERTDAEKIELELGALEIPAKIEKNGSVTLPLNGGTYADVTLAWSSDKDCAVVKDNKLNVTLPAEETTVTLTVVATLGELTETKTFEIAVDAASADLYIPKPVTAPEADTAYKFFLIQGNLGKTLYLTGEVSGRYLVTTDKPDAAVDVYAEAVEGGFKFYILVDGAKQYITVYKNADNKDSVKFDAEGATVYTYNSEVNAWVTNLDGTDKYLGTYNTFNTVSVSNLSYITAENTGVSQFPAGLATLATKEVAPVADTTPDADTAYKFFLVQGNLGKTLYLTGEVSGRYLVTTDKLSRAVDVYAEAVEGGFKFYILVDGAKQYITVYKNADNKDSVKFDAEGTTVYTYNSEVNAWVTNLDGTDKYLGTYNTFNTVSVSNLSYITAENTGVSQFPAGVATIEIVSDEPHEHTWSDATCTEPKKCDCGATDGEALGHTLTDHVCTVCGEDDPEYYWPMTIPEANASKDGKLVQVSGTVIKREGNGSVTIVDADGNELYAYKLATEVGAGDVITITGKVGSYYSSKQIASGATATIDVAHTEHNYVDGKCDVCGKADPATVTLVNTSTPITSVDQLTNGCKIVIAYGDVIMGASAGDYFGNVDVVANDDKSYSYADDAGVNVVTVEINEDGTYALKAAEGYLLAVKGSNYLKFTDDKTDALAKWTIEFVDGTLKIHVNDGDNERYINYNSSNPRFSGYKSTSNQGDVVICLVP